MSTPALHLKQFGRYEIIRKLGRGMADVYLALDPDAGRRVVLKIVEHSRDACTQMILDAERRGAMIQQQLHALDPRILEIYEYGEQDGCFFVAMQYAEGRSLSEILRKEGRLDPLRAARYAADAAGQLAVLHSFQAEIDGQRRAVVHGDIKPSNIQIGPNDEVWLLDFGIAKAITLTRNLTFHNLGSPAYCSPERLKKAQVDPHADLWALGVSLYEMVAGIPPYQAQNTRKLENLIQSRRPPRALPDNCPPALKAVLSKALAAEIERRYPSAEEFERDLRAVAAGKPTVAEREKQPSWEVNATVEKERPATAPARARQFWKTVSLAHPRALAWAVLTGLAIGVVWLIPASYFYRYWNDSKPLRSPYEYARTAMDKIDGDWQLYRKLGESSNFLGRLSPVHRLTPGLRANLLAAANDVLDRYRNGSDPIVDHFDWSKARRCLSYALELNPADNEVRGKLAVCDGYIHLLQKSPAGAKASFETAVSYLPRSPDPHLGLARVYVYGFQNIGQALAEFHEAERLGFNPGPREFEQQADGYRVRGEQQFRTWQKAGSPAEQARYLALAQRDFTRARNLYEPIAGFSNAAAGLDQIFRSEELQKRIEAEREKARLKKLRAARYRRWR